MEKNDRIILAGHIVSLLLLAIAILSGVMTLAFNLWFAVLTIVSLLMFGIIQLHIDSVLMD